MALETQRQRLRPRLGEPSTSRLGASLKPASESPTAAQEYLNNCRSFYSCIYCRTHLANHDELVSRSFQGNRSRAYLFNSVVNISCGTPVQRELNTGSHAVADIFCTNCCTTVGWKYEKAYEDSQKYKEGKYIIELVHVVRENRHLELDKRDTFMSLLAQQAGPAVIEQVATTTPFGWTGRMGSYKYGHHQGSMSPSRPCTWSSSGHNASSSSSSSSPSSSSTSSSSSSSSTSSYSSLTNSRPRDARVRYNSSGQYEDNQDDQDEPEHEEALMFPFYDDLYGNRSSYSNLSTSLSYFQRRLRRSLLMAREFVQPPPLSCDHSRQLQADRSPETRAESANSTSSIHIPSTSAAGGRPKLVAESGPGVVIDQSDYDDDRHANGDEIQFELEPSSSSLLEKNCDCSQSDASKSNSQIVGTTTQDDDEFYDCCTDHDVG